MTYSFLSRFLASVSILSLGMGNIFSVNAATGTATTGTTTGTAGKIHHFKLIGPPTAKVGEAIDVTVEAQDKDGKVVTTYKGSGYFDCQTDYGATYPAQGKAVLFSASDNGTKTFSKGVVFKRVGEQVLSFTDINQIEVSGDIKIRVEDGGTTTTPTTNETVTITTPEKGSTVVSSNVTITGKTKKNSKIRVSLNGKDQTPDGNTDSEGIFSYPLSGVSQASNIVKVSVLDGANVVIGSAERQFNYEAKDPLYYNTSVAPGLEVETGTGVTFTIDAEPGLSEVNVLIDGASIPAKEASTPGKYTLTAPAPAKAGTYPIQVNLKNVLGRTFNKNPAVILTVKDKPTPIVNTGTVNTGTVNTGVVTPPVISLPKTTFRNVVVSTVGGKVNFNFFVENMATGAALFRIAYGESPDSLSKEVTTWTFDRIRQSDGSYNWYIDGLPPGKTYSFKIFGAFLDGKLIDGFVSEPYTFTVGVQGACTIGNISNLHAESGDNKTVLTWDALSGAQSYNVYKISAAGDMELIKNVKENSYTIYLTPGVIRYDDFVIKALCDENMESTIPNKIARVQTGPGLLIFLMIIAAIGGVLLMRRKRY